MCASDEMIVEKLVEKIKEAHTNLPDDVKSALKIAYKKENNPVARLMLGSILKNIDEAEKRGVPMCQDTGIPIFFVEIGKERSMEFDVVETIKRAVREATEKIPLRPNVVHPTTRENTGNNIGVGIPEIKWDVVEGDVLKITYFPKGAGSENVSRACILKPSDVDGVKNFVLKSVYEAQGLPCPPVIVGVGVGGSFDGCALLAKKALLKPIDCMSDCEIELLDSINSLGIGPMGLGGDTTAIGVKIMWSHCHTASLPVAVNLGCWANRRATLEL